MADDGHNQTPEPLTDEEAKARRNRNIAIALGIVGFIVVVYLTTILRYAANIEAGR